MIQFVSQLTKQKLILFQRLRNNDTKGIEKERKSKANRTDQQHCIREVFRSSNVYH